MKPNHTNLRAPLFASLMSLIMAPLLFANPPGHGGGGTGGGSGGGGGGTATTFSGRSVVVDADVLGIRTVISDTGPVPATGGELQTSLLTVSVPGLLTADVLHATVVAQDNYSHSEASVADLNLTVSNLLNVTAGLLMSRASAECNGGSPTVSGSSDIALLTVNGTPIAVSGQPNQTVTLLNVTVIINEQIESGAGNITVNALHVLVTDPLNSSSTLVDIVISSAHADISCGASGCGGGDFVTGGGWITGTPSGAKGTFAVAGGLKNKGLWGHLNFIDHGSGMHVKGTGVTGYTVLSATTRRITGTCEINGQGGFTYTAVVADNGEPGRNDTFSLTLSSGYSAGGTLGGGNIQLHKPVPCH